jgi:hypothetical protein
VEEKTSIWDTFEGPLGTLSEIDRYEGLFRLYLRSCPSYVELSRYIFGRRQFRDPEGKVRSTDRTMNGTLNAEDSVEMFRNVFENEPSSEERNEEWLIETFAHCLIYDFTDSRGIRIQVALNQPMLPFDNNPMCTGCYDVAFPSPFENDPRPDRCGMCVPEEPPQE